MMQATAAPDQNDDIPTPMIIRFQKSDANIHDVLMVVVEEVGGKVLTAASTGHQLRHTCQHIMLWLITAS